VPADAAAVTAAVLCALHAAALWYGQPALAGQAPLLTAVTAVAPAALVACGQVETLLVFAAAAELDCLSSHAVASAAPPANRTASAVKRSRECFMLHLRGHGKALGRAPGYRKIIGRNIGKPVIGASIVCH
jgi:hypothetical protein